MNFGKDELDLFGQKEYSIGNSTAAGTSAVVGASVVVPSKADGMSKITIAAIVLLVIGLIVAGVMAWRNCNSGPTCDPSIAACPDPDRKQDLLECHGLMGRAKRAWVRDLLQRAIAQHAAEPHGSDAHNSDNHSSDHPPPRRRDRRAGGGDVDPSEAIVVGSGGGETDPLFDGN